jgi:autotransporter-associated beta strand protein
VLNNINTYTGPTTITSGVLRYGGSDPAIQNNAQAYTLSPANPAGNQTGFSLGLDFNVNAGRVITITQLGVFDNGRNGFANAHTAYIYNRDTQGVLTSIPFSAGATGALSADGYRFLSLSTPLTLSAGNYTVVADYSGTDLEVNAGLNGGQNQGTTFDGGGAISFVGVGRYGTPGSFPTSPGGAVPYTFGAGSFVFNSLPAGRIPGDVTINGATAVLDLGNNQNGNVATVTLDGGGSIIGTGTAKLLSRTSFQMKSGTVTAILAGAGIPLVKTTTGTVTLSGANTYSGNTTVSAGTLKLNIASGTPTIASGVIATVASGATLELAGSISALGTAGGNRVRIVNDSTASGLVVSGTIQVVGAIDGLGSTQVDEGSDLTADHIIQSALAIDGAAGSPGLVTIDASDANGSPLDEPSGFALAGSLTPSGPFGAPNVNTASTIPVTADSADLAVVALAKSVGSVNPSVPEPSTLLLALLAVLGVISTQFLRRHFRSQTA